MKYSTAPHLAKRWEIVFQDILSFVETCGNCSDMFTHNECVETHAQTLHKVVEVE